MANVGYDEHAMLPEDTINRTSTGMKTGEILRMAKSTQTENRYSVCIGINDYAPGAALGALHYAEADARALDALLGQRGFPDDHRKLLLGKDATLDAVNAALGEIIRNRAGENDLVIFYFAGHSKPIRPEDDDESEVFLASYDFDAEKIRKDAYFREEMALGMGRVRSRFFERGRSRQRLFIFDSCYSGDVFGSPYRDATTVQEHMEQVFTTKSPGRIALSSCLPTQKALEHAKYGHGLFTYYLLKVLSGEDPTALRSDGCLTANRLFEYVAGKLKEEGSQRPVLSGVQHDIFEVICYPHLAKRRQDGHEEEEAQQDRRHAEKDKRLRAMFADHSSFMRDRLESFVGRQVELAEIRLLTQEKMPTGGYVTITGQAGQGKSSIIAQLVKEHIAEQGTEERVIYHFILFNPGLDSQVGLLRNLIARLMFKHDLSDLYIEYVAYGNRPALRDFFPRVLQEIAEKGVQEVIFIDGLDQLEEDFNGLRDLSFLPPNPPPGIVFVLGTRPNDTLHPLELLKPHSQYALPNLSRFDFDLILQHRGVCLSPDITDQFYRTMQENALFLDLVAKELTAAGAAITPDEMIKKLANNPANLFSFALARLERSPEWEIIEQILGFLLVSREPLSFGQLRHMIGVKDRQLRNAIARLGGLLTESAPKGQPEYRRYSLFHLMFQDFLGQNEDTPRKDYLFATSEVERYHSVVARWCEGEQLALIWQDSSDQVEQERKTYARQHYITHLYLAKKWPQLFDVLNKGDLY